MVRVPGSSGDSGFHREFTGEDVKIMGLKRQRKRDRRRREKKKDPRMIKVLGGALIIRK